MYKKNVFLNVGGSFVTQAVSMVISLIIPKLMISKYGSEINGLVSSSSQIVQYFAIFEGGISAAAGFSLFGALRKKDTEKINGVFSAVDIFFKKTGSFMILLTILFSLIFPLTLSNSTSYVTGIIIVLLSCFVTALGYLNYFKYNLIIFSDQKQYITLFSNSLTRIMICILQIWLMLNNFNILIVVSITPVFSILRLWLIKKYVLSSYPYLDKGVVPDNSALDQKWDSMSINVSKMIKTIIPIIFISIFFGFKYASVYNIYLIVFSVGRSILETAGNGLSATMGNIVAEGNLAKTKKIYIRSSNLIFLITNFLSICFLFLTLPFIDLYIGKADISYNAPFLLITLIINEGLNNLTFTPNLLIRATGKFKETSRSAVIEVVLALILTPVGLYFFGYQGALLGSMFSSFIRLIYITHFCRNLLSLTYKTIYRNIIFSVFCFITSFVLIHNINVEINTYIEWLTYAVFVGIVSAIVSLIYNYLLIKRKGLLNK